MSQKRICLWHTAQPEHKRLQQPTTKHTAPQSLGCGCAKQLFPTTTKQKTQKTKNCNPNTQAKTILKQWKFSLSLK